jgi:hypothetical protein
MRARRAQSARWWRNITPTYPFCRVRNERARAHFDASQPTEKKYNNFNVLLRQQPKRKNLLFPSFPPPLPTRCKSPFQSLVIIQPEWGGGLLDCIKQVLVMHNFFSLSPYIHSRWWLFRDVYVTGGSIARFFFQTNFKLGCLLVRKKRVFFFHSFNWALQMLHFPLIREFRIRFFFPVKEKQICGRKEEPRGNIHKSVIK